MNLRRKLSRLAVVCGLALSMAASAFAQQSNEVPTEQLSAAFNVEVSPGSSHAQLRVYFDKATVGEDGQDQWESLVVSLDEEIVFSVGSVQVKYDPLDDEHNQIPFIPGATYSVRFKRPNGETFSTQSVMVSEAVKFSQPADLSRFLKTQPVEIKWNQVAADFPLTFMFAACENRSHKSRGGDVTYTDNSATIPAGYALDCPNQFDVMFTTAYINQVPFAGLNGALNALTVADVVFSLVDSLRGRGDFSGLDRVKERDAQLRHSLRQLSRLRK